MLLLFLDTHKKKENIKIERERTQGGLAKSDRQGWQANYLMVLGS